VKRTGGKARPISQEIDGGGWVKLWRKSLDSDVFADPHLWRLFSWCLLSASHTGRHVGVKTGRGETVITLGPGQFIYGRKSAARELGWPESTLNDRMKRLEAMGTITIQADTHHSTVTVVNWGLYQPKGGDTRHPNNTQAAGKRHPSDGQPTGNRHIQEGREGKEGAEGREGKGC
jgi:hypothetical protein